MKKTLSVQALVLAIIVVPSALVAEGVASTNTAPIQEPSQHSVDYSLNQRDIAKTAVSSARPATEVSSFATNSAASARQPADSIASAQSTNQATVRSTVSLKRQRGATDPLEMMKQSLSLSDDQARKVEPVLKEHLNKIDAFRRDTSLSRQDRVARLKEMQTALDTKIKQHLTPEQAEKWQKTRFNQQPLMQQHGQAATNASPYSARTQAEKGGQPRPSWQTRMPQPQQPQPQPAQPGAPK